MIVLFPMLISKSVSPNVIPGICKTLEKFTLIYKMDSILAATGLVGATITAAKASNVIGMFRHSESEVISEIESGSRPGTKPQANMPNIIIQTGGKKDKDGGTNAVVKSEFEKQKLEIEDAKTKSQALSVLQQDFKVDVFFPQSNSLHIEPTWITLSSSSGTHLVGVKVVPFPIETKTDKDIISLMLSDSAKRSVDSEITAISRKLIRVLFTIARTFRLPFLSKIAIKEDPVDSILFAKSEHGKNIYLCLNYSDINNSKLVLNASGVKQLFHMGWTSFIVADDINKRAIFCMNEFKGMCSAVPYPFLYSSVSRDAAKVYSDLEDIRTSASPFFRINSGVKLSKVVGESVAYRKLQDYLNSL